MKKAVLAIKNLNHLLMVPMLVSGSDSISMGMWPEMNKISFC